VTGYGVIAAENGALRFLECGNIRTVKKAPLAEKLEQIYEDAESVIREFKPEEIVVEKAFYHKNAQVAMILGHVRGAIMLAGQRNGCHVVELTPTSVKKAVTRNGNASKHMVQYMVTKILKLKAPPGSPDAADALAVALAHGLSVTRG
jgi:crossover junction endodeoxyribonuclease RuvC